MVPFSSESTLIHPGLAKNDNPLTFIDQVEREPSGFAPLS